MVVAASNRMNDLLKDRSGARRTRRWFGRRPRGRGARARRSRGVGPAARRLERRPVGGPRRWPRDRSGGALPRPARARGRADAPRAPDRGKRDPARSGGDLQGAGRGAGPGVRAPQKGGVVTEKEVVRTEGAPAPF